MTPGWNVCLHGRFWCTFGLAKATAVGETITTRPFKHGNLLLSMLSSNLLTWSNRWSCYVSISLYSIEDATKNQRVYNKEQKWMLLTFYAKSLPHATVSAGAIARVCIYKKASFCLHSRVPSRTVFARTLDLTLFFDVKSPVTCVDVPARKIKAGHKFYGTKFVLQVSTQIVYLEMVNKRIQLPVADYHWRAGI